MILTDVNLLVYAHREDFDQHLQYRQWLEHVLESGEPFAMANVVLSGFRVGMHGFCSSISVLMSSTVAEKTMPFHDNRGTYFPFVWDHVR